jgi:hypothetical protein
MSIDMGSVFSIFFTRPQAKGIRSLLDHLPLVDPKGLYFDVLSITSMVGIAL